MNPIIWLIFLVNVYQVLCLNYCQNCKYYKITIDGDDINEICLEKYKFVKSFQNFEKCVVARSYEDMCGIFGKQYEPLFNDDDDNEFSSNIDEDDLENILFMSEIQSLVVKGMKGTYTYNLTIEDMQLLISSLPNDI
jgi:hypothetical protein